MTTIGVVSCLNELIGAGGMKKNVGTQQREILYLQLVDGMRWEEE